MKILKIGLCMLLSIILICSAIVFQLLISFKHDSLSEKFYIQKCEKSKIYDKYEKSIENTFSKYAVQNKLPSSASNDIISSLWVQEQFETVIKGITSFMKNDTNSLPIIDTKTPTDNFNANVAAKLNARNINIDSSILGEEKEFYKSYDIIPFTQSWNKINGDSFKSDLKDYRSYLPYISIACYFSGFLIIVCVLLLFLVIKNLSKWKLWAGYSLIIGGLIPSISAFIISNSNKVQDYLNTNLNISKDSIYPHNASISLVADIINSLLMGITKYSGVLVFIGITIIVIVSLSDSKKDNVSWYKHKPLKFK